MLHQCFAAPSARHPIEPSSSDRGLHKHHRPPIHNIAPRAPSPLFQRLHLLTLSGQSVNLFSDFRLTRPASSASSGHRKYMPLAGPTILSTVFSPPLPFGLSQRTLWRLRQTQIQKPLNTFSLPPGPRENPCCVDPCTGNGLRGRVAKARLVIALDQQSRDG